MKIFLVLVLLIYSFLSFPQEVRVYSAVGGSESDNYFTDGISDFREAFNAMGVMSENQNLYFGGSERNGRCISKFQKEYNGTSVEQYRQIIANAKSCDDFRITLALRFLTGINLPKEKDCESLVSDDLKMARKEFVTEDLLKENLSSGDVVYIHLADHGGDETYGDGDWIINMSNEDSIKAQDLKKFLRKAAVKNVKVQMSFDACYSGGFTDAVSQIKSELKEEGLNVGRLLCSSSSTESNFVGYESDPLLKAGFSETYFKAMKKYGNQLSAFACSAGADSLNIPITTLDRFVDNKGTISTLVPQMCFPSFYREQNSELDQFVKSIEDISLKIKIETLVQDFQEFFGDVMVECYDERVIDQKIVKMIDQCLPEDHQYAYLLKPFLKEASKARQHDQQTIARHVAAIRALKNENELSEYLDEFCCLAQPFDKNKLGPKSCEF